MANIRERFGVDKNGKRVVYLDIVDCKDLMAEIEQEECVRAYDAAKLSMDESIAFEEAAAAIESDRR